MGDLFYFIFEWNYYCIYILIHWNVFIFIRILQRIETMAHTCLFSQNFSEMFDRIVLNQIHCYTLCLYGVSRILLIYLIYEMKNFFYCLFLNVSDKMTSGCCLRYRSIKSKWCSLLFFFHSLLNISFIHFHAIVFSSKTQFLWHLMSFILKQA